MSLEIREVYNVYLWFENSKLIIWKNAIQIIFQNIFKINQEHLKKTYMKTKKHIYGSDVCIYK